MLQDFSYRKGDYLLFGAETTGLPPEALLDCKTEPFGGGTIKIPMVETYVRCLNLSVSVGIALYEASRQLNYESLQIPSETCIDTEEESFITEDIFGWPLYKLFNSLLKTFLADHYIISFHFSTENIPFPFSLIDYAWHDLKPDQGHSPSVGSFKN